MPEPVGVSAFERLIDILREHGYRGTRSGSTAKYQCPAHADDTPSLSLRAIEGEVLIHDFGGCNWEDVLTALNLTKSDKYDDPTGSKYVYLDETGAATRTVHRSPDKRFVQSGDKSRALLFRLPQVIDGVQKGRTIYLVEGEKDVLALEAAQQVATTAPQGVEGFGKVDVSVLEGASVVAVPDKDAAGLKWAQTVRDRLDGWAKTIVFRKALIGKDFADHYAAGKGVPDLVPIEIHSAQRRLEVRTGDTIPVRATRWLWENGERWLPLGGLSLLGGREGVGKSTIAYWLAAQLTNGQLPGEFKGVPRSVVIAATEDAWSETVMPRLMAAGADCSRIIEVVAKEPDGSTTGLILPTDVAGLKKVCAERDVAMILLDPLLGTVHAKLDSHKDAEVRQALEPLSRLAHDAGLAIVGLIHLNKSQTGDLLTRIMASRAFSAVARSVLMAARDTEDVVEGIEVPGDRFVFGQIKNNLARRVPYVWRYTIEELTVAWDEDLDRPIRSSRIVWGETVTGGLDDLLAQQEQKPRRETARDRAMEWLDGQLRNGPRPSVEIKAAAERVGIAEATLKRAMKDMKVRVSPIPGTVGGATQWSLEGIDPGELGELSDLRDLSELTSIDEDQSSSDQSDHGSGTGNSDPSSDPKPQRERPPTPRVKRGVCEICDKPGRLFPKGWRCPDHA